MPPRRQVSCSCWKVSSRYPSRVSPTMAVCTRAMRRGKIRQHSSIVLSTRPHSPPHHPSRIISSIPILSPQQWANPRSSTGLTPSSSLPPRHQTNLVSQLPPGITDPIAIPNPSPTSAQPPSLPRSPYNIRRVVKTQVWQRAGI